MMFTLKNALQIIAVMSEKGISKKKCILFLQVTNNIFQKELPLYSYYLFLSMYLVHTKLGECL